MIHISIQGEWFDDNVIANRSIFIDKNAAIGDNVVIKPFPLDANVDHALYVVRDGIVVIPKNTTIPAGTVIQP